MSFHQVIKCRSADTQYFSRLQDVTFSLRHRFVDKVLFNHVTRFFQFHAADVEIMADGFNQGLVTAGLRRKTEVYGLYSEGFRHNHRPLDPVFELADISGPIVAIYSPERCNAEAFDSTFELVCVATHEQVGEQVNIITSVLEQWQIGSNDPDSVVQVLSELTVLDRLFDVNVGRCHNPGINFNIFPAANSLDDFFLEKA